MYQKEVTKETAESFAKGGDLEQFLPRMKEHEWAMLRYLMDRHATRKLHVPLGSSLLSMLIGSCCCSGCCDRGVDNGGSRLCNIGGGTDCGGIEGFNGGGGSDGGGGVPHSELVAIGSHLLCQCFAKLAERCMML